VYHTFCFSKIENNETAWMMDLQINNDEMEQNAERAAAFLKSIAHRHRLLVLCKLMAGDMTAGALGETLNVRPANMSQHLSWLKKEGLVASRREGTTVHYSLASPDVTPLISTLYEMFCGGDKQS